MQSVQNMKDHTSNCAEKQNMTTLRADVRRITHLPLMPPSTIKKFQSYNIYKQVSNAADAKERGGINFDPSIMQDVNGLITGHMSGTGGLSPYRANVSQHGTPMADGNAAALVGGVCLRVQPLQYAMHMKSMIALSPNRRAVVSRDLAVNTTPIKGHAANPAALIVDIPVPFCHSLPTLDSDFHSLYWPCKVQPSFASGQLTSA
eukprot:CAMPEP_0177634804 /NCGR_PEP_ID=MMETSP0447-20121125/3560_1 /TAXON_ID=0 /ORGANISM="Stygamoeba regulata, Strain BSH-02190019" /LENGTH=203 /DNA_ID=CAMNT_0019136543 /DNA_START=142 /DNA_END=751 /DNA_ORIENTATION=+